jgi:hypothetical protein
LDPGGRRRDDFFDEEIVIGNANAAGYARMADGINAKIVEQFEVR